MSEKISAAFITNEEKVNLQAGDLFDRIINLKLSCVNQETEERETFVIRSDYEIIFPETMPVDGSVATYMKNKCIIRRCAHKPSIKVVCKMVSTNTGINAEVFVSNFFMLTKDGKHLRSFNSSQYKIEKVEIAMGYWAQFRVGEEKDSEAPTYDEYFEINAENGADKIILTGAIIVTTDKLPPDSVLRIKGFVADVYSSPVAVSEIDSADTAASQPVASSGKGFEEIVYTCITKRYLNLHNVTDVELKTSKKNIPVSDIKNFPVSVSYDKQTGLLGDTDADKYGVKVYLSKGAKALQIPKLYDSEGNEVENTMYFESGWTIGQTIARISSFMKVDLEFTFNKEGDVLIYLLSEATHPDELYESFKADKLYEKTIFANKSLYDNKLPCVYNINIDAIATIVCPFFTFLEPFQYVEFASRYALTSMVSYFASYNPTIYKFLIINATISFATVDNINEVQLTAVASKGK